MYYILALLVLFNMHIHTAQIDICQLHESMKDTSTRSLSSSSDRSLAKSSPTFKLTDNGIRIAEMQTSHEIRGKCTHDELLLRATEHRLKKIVAKKTIAEQRLMALNFVEVQKSVVTRADAWQAYHMGVIDELQTILQDHIPSATINPHDASFSHSIDILTTDQQSALDMYVIAYALLLSEQDQLDTSAFEQAYNRHVAIPQISNAFETRRKKRLKCVCVLQ